MGIRLKFNLALMIIFVIGLILTGLVTGYSLQKNARQEILQNARIIMESAVAVHGDTSSASVILHNLQARLPDFNYREALLHSAAGENLAVDWETNIIQYFRDHPEVTELTGERKDGARALLFLGRPITAGTGAELTPAHIIGAQIVSVPMKLPLQRAEATFWWVMSAMAFIFMAGAVLLNAILHWVVLRPVAQMSAQANMVSLGHLEVPELEIKGDDELSSLGRSFNRMHRSLKNAVDLIDDSD